MSDNVYSCEACRVDTPAARMSWPDLCDRCYWRVNLGAGFALAGLAAYAVHLSDMLERAIVFEPPTRGASSRVAIARLAGVEGAT